MCCGCHVHGRDEAFASLVSALPSATRRTTTCREVLRHATWRKEARLEENDEKLGKEQSMRGMQTEAHAESSPEALCHVLKI